MDGPTTRVDRRTLLRSLSAGGAATLAGCTDLLTTDGGSKSETPRIEIESGRRRDARLVPTLVGFVPGTDVTVTARATDAEDRTWRSHAVVTTDRQGTASLGSTAPAAGTYADARSMGLFWSMGLKYRRPPTYFVQDGAEQTVTLTARVADEVVAERTVTRVFAPSGVTHERVRDEDRGLVGHYFEPSGEGPHPGVVALHGNGNSPLTNFGRMLAARGFAVLAPKWFGEEAPIPDQLVEIPLSSARAMATWLQSREAVTDRIGVLGHSKGAEFALLAATRYDVFDGVVAIAPNAFAFMAPGTVSPGPSWVVDGEPVPTLSRSGSSEIRRKEGRLVIADQIRADLAAAEQAQLDRAAIPAEQISGDVLLVGGLDDTIWPMEEMIPRLTARLDSDGFQHRFASLVYDEAGHVITVPHKPTTYHHLGGQLYLGGQPGAAAAAESDAWPRMVRWFRDALSGSAQ